MVEDKTQRCPIREDQFLIKDCPGAGRGSGVDLPRQLRPRPRQPSEDRDAGAGCWKWGQRSKGIETANLDQQG